MKAKWFIEDTNFDDEDIKLVNEVKAQGYEVEVMKSFPYNSKEITAFEDGDCVVAQCSINMADKIMNTRKWVPGVWYNKKAYECQSYYPYFKEYLFNEPCKFTTVADVNKNRETYFREFGIGQHIFVRPNDGVKSFTGTVIPLHEFDYKWVWIDQYAKQDDIVLVSSAKTVKAEWRFIAAEGTIISGSRYTANGDHERVNKYPLEAYDLAMTIAESGYDPDPMWSIDICEGIDNKYYLLEIGNFNCCGLYANDLAIIVDTASKIAEAQWIKAMEDAQ